jgi:hypothetical protein
LRHLSGDELTELYYGQGTPEAHAHLEGCEECRVNLARTEDVLQSMLQYPVPEPEPGYEARVWAELLPRLDKERGSRTGWLFRSWILAPAFAALLIAAVTVFIAQRRHSPPGISTQEQARMLLISLGDHLDRSQILLAELVNAEPGRHVLDEERENARDLADENRLLRQASSRNGNASNGALLEDLERVLLSVANAPTDASSEELAALQRRIDDEGLLFKVRVTGSDLRREEQKL